MVQMQMYPAVANSPATEIATAITNTATTITLLNASRLPDAPNIATIGVDETAETIQYATKSGNVLSGVVRGFNGTAAKAWTVGTKVARYFTAYDADSMRENITEHTAQLADIAINVMYPPSPLIGAGGDGVSDDTAALQAIFYLANVMGSVKIIFPKGVYKTTTFIRVYKNTTVDFNPEAVILRGGGSSHFKMFMNGEFQNWNYASGYNGDGNIHFKGGTIDLDTWNNPVGVNNGTGCFDLGHASNVTFRDMTFKNGQNGHYFQIASSEDILFDHCHFQDTNHTRPDYFMLETVQFEEATAEAFPVFGSFDKTICRNITLNDCTFKNVIRGVGAHSYVRDVDGVTPVRWHENIKIIACVFENTVEDAINFEAFKRSLVEGNSFKNVGGYGYNLGYSHENRISRNKLNGAGKAAAYLGNSNGNIFSGNIHFDTSQNGDASFSALRLSFSNDNIFENEVVNAMNSVKYNYPIYFTDSSGNNIINPIFANGINGGYIAGGSGQLTSNHVGAKSVELFNGDLSVINDIGILSMNIRTFSSIVVIANDNGSATASLVSMIIPKVALISGTTVGRFRLIPDDGKRIVFSFPSETSIRLDDLLVAGHIRKVVGIV